MTEERLLGALGLPTGLYHLTWVGVHVGAHWTILHDTANIYFVPSSLCVIYLMVKI